MENNYIEIAEQLFNLVDNDKDKINAFYDAINVESTESKKMVQHWFDINVKDQELKDLYKKGENNSNFLKWIVSPEGTSYFNETPQEISQDNIDTFPNNFSKEKIEKSKSQIQKSIETEDDSIMSPKEKEIKTDMSDGKYSSDNVDDEDEIELALQMMDGSDEDVDIVFDIMDGSDEDEEFDDSSEDEEFAEEIEDEIHKKRIYLDHHLNKVIEEIDNEEEIDRFAHKKYYVMKKKELISTDKMNDLEDELDKQNISYYDFGKNDTIAIKIYTQNEVNLNRIFEKMEFKCRCVDIAHYTDDWYSTSNLDINSHINEAWSAMETEDAEDDVEQDLTSGIVKFKNKDEIVKYVKEFFKNKFGYEMIEDEKYFKENTILINALKDENFFEKNETNLDRPWETDLHFNFNMLKEHDIWNSPYNSFYFNLLNVYESRKTKEYLYNFEGEKNSPSVIFESRNPKDVYSYDGYRKIAEYYMPSFDDLDINCIITEIAKNSQFEKFLDLSFNIYEKLKNYVEKNEEYIKNLPNFYYENPQEIDYPAQILKDAGTLNILKLYEKWPEKINFKKYIFSNISKDTFLNKLQNFYSKHLTEENNVNDVLDEINKQRTILYDSFYLDFPVFENKIFTDSKVWYDFKNSIEIQISFDATNGVDTKMRDKKGDYLKGYYLRSLAFLFYNTKDCKFVYAYFKKLPNNFLGEDFFQTKYCQKKQDFNFLFNDVGYVSGSKVTPSQILTYTKLKELNNFVISLKNKIAKLDKTVMDSIEFTKKDNYAGVQKFLEMMNLSDCVTYFLPEET